MNEKIFVSARPPRVKHTYFGTRASVGLQPQPLSNVVIIRTAFILHLLDLLRDCALPLFESLTSYRPMHLCISTLETEPVRSLRLIETCCIEVVWIVDSFIGWWTTLSIPMDSRAHRTGDAQKIGTNARCPYVQREIEFDNSRATWVGTESKIFS
jgi:hypothetical protein